MRCVPCVMDLQEKLDPQHSTCKQVTGSPLGLLWATTTHEASYHQQQASLTPWPLQQYVIINSHHLCSSQQPINPITSWNYCQALLQYVITCTIPIHHHTSSLMKILIVSLQSTTNKWYLAFSFETTCWFQDYQHCPIHTRSCVDEVVILVAHMVCTFAPLTLHSSISSSPPHSSPPPSLFLTISSGRTCHSGTIKTASRSFGGSSKRETTRVRTKTAKKEKKRIGKKRWQKRSRHAADFFKQIIHEAMGMS